MGTRPDDLRHCETYLLGKAQLAAVFGTEFLEEFVVFAAQYLEAELLTVGALRLADTERVTVLASHCSEMDLAGFEYETCIAPCHDVITSGQQRVVQCDLQRLYPDDELFEELGFHSYVGYPLKNAGGNVIGLVQASWKRGIGNHTTNKAIEVFSEFAARLSHTLEAASSHSTLRALAITGSDLGKDDVFRVLAENIQSALTAKVAFIAECSEERPDHFRILSYCQGGEIIDDVEGALVPYSETPCKMLLGQKKAVVETRLWRLFPNQAHFKELGLESYLGVAVHDKQGQLIGHVAVQSDRNMSSRIADTDLVNVLTDRIEVELQRHRSEQRHREAEAALFVKKKNESLGLLAGSVSHDFNNLLSTMIGQTELAMHGLGESHPVAENLKTISSCLDTSSELVGQLLTYAKGSPSPEMRYLDLKMVVEEVIRLLPLEKASREFSLDFPEGPLPILADHAQISQMLMNLILNAIEAMQGREGAVSIRGRCHHLTREEQDQFVVSPGKVITECVLLEVCDQGIGMNSEIATRVFDPYFTTKEEGKGLGMAMVVGTVRRHNAAISLESRENQGTCFRVAFPLNSRPRQTGDKETQSAGASTHPGDVRKILVVDDEPILRATVEALLKLQNFNVTLADGLETAKSALCLSGPFDCALVDITMPEANGWQVKFELEALQPDLVCVMMSGYSISPTDAGFPEMEGTPILDKPFRAPDLVSVLRQAMKCRVETIAEQGFVI